MKYPEWAPRVLCELHTELKTKSQVDSTYLDTLERLVSRPGMQTVWPALTKRHCKEWMIKHFGILSDNDQFIRSFALNVFVARSGPSRWDRATNKQRRERTYEIASTARKLARLIGPTPYNCTVNAYAEQVGAQEIMTFDRVLEVPRYVGQPLVSEFLMVLSGIVKEAKEKPSILPRPNRDDVNSLHFVRALSQYVRVTYRQPLHEVVASTASAMLDEIIDRDYVRRNTSQPHSLSEYP